MSFVSLAYTCSPSTLVPKLVDSQLVGLSQRASKCFLDLESNLEAEAKIQTFVQIIEQKNEMTLEQTLVKNTEKSRKIFLSSFNVLIEV